MWFRPQAQTMTIGVTCRGQTVKKAFARLAVLLLLVVTCPTAAMALDARQIFERNEASLFQIRVINRDTGNKSSIGSGFIFERGNLLATNYHVVSEFIEKPDSHELRYLGTDGSEGPLKLLNVDAVHDLALVEADRELGVPLLAGEPPPKGADLFAMGNPLDLGLTIAAGTNGGVLSQTDGSRILFSGSLNPGMSGGPTFDDRGVVVGINVSTARNDISFIVPTRFLEPLARKQAASAETLLREIADQVRTYQLSYLNSIRTASWSTTAIGKIEVPGAISPTVRCWDTSTEAEPELLYRRYGISCKNENDIYLTDRLEVGKLIYEYLWIESDDLEALRFHRLYRALNNSQFGSRAGEDDVSRFRCDTRFVDVNGLVMKTTLCVRDYLNYPGLSDILFTSALTGKDRVGFIFNLDLSGTDFATANRLIVQFLKNIQWQS